MVRSTDPLTFRRRRPLLAQTLVRRFWTTLTGPRIQLVLAPPAQVAQARGAAASTTVHENVPELRIRDSLVLRERLERTVMRALRLERRVERETREWQLPAVAQSGVTPPPRPTPAPTFVYRTVSPAAVDAARLERVAPAAAAEVIPASQRTDVAALTDEVLRVLDHRIVAERERRGRV
jgi:hypothetical protein